MRERSTSGSNMKDKERLVREKGLIQNVMIVEYRREIISSYLLNTGYVGTYEPTYKLLYNRREE